LTASLPPTILIARTKTIFLRSKLLGIVTSFSEMKQRVFQAFEGLHAKCAEEYGPMVSIIIPTRNERARIAALIKSVRASCYKNIEIVVADYMFTDGTPEIARTLGARVLELDKPGVGYASAIAVENSRGDIIIRTNADAVFQRNLISVALEMLRNEEKLVAHIGHVYYDGDPIENLMAFIYDKYLREVWQTTGHFIAFKRDIVEKGVNFNPKLKYDDDWDFGRRVYLRFGGRVFAYDHRPSILVSARRIHRTGLLKYILGFRER